MKTTVELFTEELLQVFEGHRNIDSFARACSQLAPKFPEFYSNSKPNDANFGALETAFRLYLEQEILKYLSVSIEILRETISRLFDLSLWCSSNGLARDSLPFVLMEDIYDLLTIGQCEELFIIFESRYKELREFIGKSSGRFLRANNSLLTRLSQSINIKLKGRVLLFVALCIPLSDKSGLNMNGEINVKNVTEFEEELPADMDLSSDHKKPIDFKFYRTFWALQSYFQNPNAVIASANFLNFVNSATTVLDAFSTAPLHCDDSKKSTTEDMEVDGNQESISKTLDACPPFFKYLTSTRLLNTQLSDVYFRRNILVQFSILFHTLYTTYEKDLTEKQKEQLEKLQQQVNSNLKRCSGQEFIQILNQTLDMEKHWVAWKKEKKCSKFEQAPSKIEPYTYKREFELFDERDLGSSSLTKLWNLSNTNLDCLSKKTILPTVKKFVADELLFEDPDEEEELKLSNDKKFLWKSCRLIGRENLLLFKAMDHKVSQFEKLKQHFAEPEDKPEPMES